MKHCLFIVFAVARLAGCRAHQAETKPAAPAGGTEAAITPRDLEQRLFLVAHDSLMGRETGSEGAYKTAEYVASEYRRLGLEPAGDNGTYFQTVPFWTVAPDAHSRLTTSTGATLALGTDFLPVSFAAPPRVLDQASVVYAGSQADTGQLIPPTQLLGKFVIIDVPPPPRGDRRAVGALVGRYRDAAAIGVVALDQLGSEQIARVREGRPVADSSRSPRANALRRLSR